MKCFYHSADLDGHCAGAIVKHKYPDCEMVGINYGDEFPWNTIKDEEVIVVDFSLQPFSEMEKLDDICQLTWIDHHISAIDAYYDSGLKTINALLNIQKAACEITHRFLYGSKKIPYFIWLLGRYDVWDSAANEDVLPFQYGMRMEDTLPGEVIWEKLFNHLSLTSIIDKGKVIIAYESMQNAKYIKTCVFETEFDGYKAIAVNKGLTNSLLFNSIWDESKYDIMIAFVIKNKKYTVSLYTTKTSIDVSEIAKKYGGGGHRQAAGFQCKELSFTFIPK